jgi:hypothetical protein
VVAEGLLPKLVLRIAPVVVLVCAQQQQQQQDMVL